MVKRDNNTNALAEAGKYHILSQVDVVKALYESGQFNTSVFDKPISSFQDIFEYQPKLVTLTEDTPAIEVCCCSSLLYKRTFY